MHFIQSIKQTYTFFRWLRNSLIQDGVDILLRYQTILFYASMLWAIYGMSQKQAHDLLKVFIWSSLPKIETMNLHKCFIKQLSTYVPYFLSLDWEHPNVSNINYQIRYYGFFRRI